MNKLMIILLIISLLFLIFIFVQVRKKRLNEAYSLVWICAGIVIVIISIFPNILQLVSNIIGIYYAPTTLFLILIFFILLLLLQFSIITSKKNQQIRKLAQEIALLSKKVNDLAEKSEK